jgi:hypothetical protein
VRIAWDLHPSPIQRRLERFNQSQPSGANMHTFLKAVVLLFCAFVPAFAHGQNALDDRYKITLYINGRAVQGSQELYVLTAGRSSDVSGAVYDNNPPIPLVSGQTFQAVVSITDPSGATADYTQSVRLKYETFGCMTASPLGTVTATPMTGEQCDGPEYPELWVELMDASGNVFAINGYLFHVAPG